MFLLIIQDTIADHHSKIRMGHNNSNESVEGWTKQHNCLGQQQFTVITHWSTTFDLEISLLRNCFGALRFLPSLLPKWLYETMLRPSCSSLLVEVWVSKNNISIKKQYNGPHRFYPRRYKKVDQDGLYLCLKKHHNNRGELGMCLA